MRTAILGRYFGSSGKQAQHLEPLLGYAMTSEGHDGSLDALDMSSHNGIDQPTFVLK
jgi:hypothetical protein